MSNIVRIIHPGRKLHEIFLRFQEYYESPEFRGRVFTRKTFDAWYKQSKGTNYHEDWCGFNLPSNIIDDFRSGDFNPLSPDEQYLLTCCQGLVSPFYVIGVPTITSVATIKHELGHALYYMNAQYREAVNEILDQAFALSDRASVEGYLLATGYCAEVLTDEIHAYALTGDLPATNLRLRVGVSSLQTQLETAYDAHYGEITFLDFFPQGE